MRIAPESRAAEMASRAIPSRTAIPGFSPASGITEEIPGESMIRGSTTILELLRIGTDREAIEAGCIRGCDAHARIECKNASFIRHERVDVDFDDLGNVGDQLRQLHQRSGDRTDVRRRPAIVSGQQPGNMCARDEVACEHGV